MARLRALIGRLGLTARAAYVERASLPEARACPLAEAPDAGAVFLDDPDQPDGATRGCDPLPDRRRRGAGAADRRSRRRHGARPGRAGGGVRSPSTGRPHMSATLFAAGTPVVGVCAAGILIRAVAPLLADKRAEPPVIAVAEDGSAVVPLLGGHRGANALARRIAEALGVRPAITTAGDLSLGLALDEPPPGWRLANPAAAKPVMAGLLAGDAYRLWGRLSGEAEWLAPLAALPNVAAGASDAAGDAVALEPVAGGPALSWHPHRPCARRRLRARLPAGRAGGAGRGDAGRGRDRAGGAGRRVLARPEGGRAGGHGAGRGARRAGAVLRRRPAGGRDAAAGQPLGGRLRRGRLPRRRRGRGAGRGRACRAAGGAEAQIRHGDLRRRARDRTRSSICPAGRAAGWRSSASGRAPRTGARPRRRA